MIIVKKSLLAKIIGVDGIVLYPFIFFADEHPGETLIRHELVHVDQIKKCGIILFYFRYCKEYLIFRSKKMSHDQAYRSISFEKEAYEKQKLS